MKSELGSRLPANPLLRWTDLTPSLPSLEVVSVCNAAATKIGDEILLILRVGERPRQLSGFQSNLQTLDLAGSQQSRLLPVGTLGESLVGVCFLDSDRKPPQVVVAYLPRDLPGLDLSDPRTVRYESKLGDLSETRVYLTQMSHLRVARSNDGIKFTVDETPAVVPSDPLDQYGCEDPRATFIDGNWQITYVSVGRLGMSTSRLSTIDFRSFSHQGIMFLPDHKDVVIFPERIGGRYAALTRPMPQSFDQVLGIWISYSDDLVQWGGHRPVAFPRPGMWDERKTGAGTVPFRAPEGWIELYHGVDRNERYSMGALLLDRDDPSRVIARSPAPILIPSEPYEQSGVFSNVVFACGHVPLDDRGEVIRMYYGAADACLAAVDFRVSDIIEQLVEC